MCVRTKLDKNMSLIVWMGAVVKFVENIERVGLERLDVGWSESDFWCETYKRWKQLVSIILGLGREHSP